MDNLYKSLFWDYEGRAGNTSQAIIINKGKGIYFEDLKGRKYIDGISSLGCNVWGHNNRYLNQALRSQLARISFTPSDFDINLVNKPEIILADKLVNISPKGLKRVIFCNSGSEAVEMALKVSLLYWRKIEGYNTKRSKIIYFERGYHGDTFGALSICGSNSHFKKLYKSILPKNICVFSPYCYQCKFGENIKTCNMKCFFYVEKIVEKYYHEIAGIIIEPVIQIYGGLIIQPVGYLKRLRKLADKFGILLIFDEVATGFGKTGKMFASEYENITADIMCIGKALSGGYLPISAVLIKEKIYKYFYENSKINILFDHGHTYSGNQLSCAVSIANLELFEKSNILEKLSYKTVLLEKLLKKFYTLDIIGEVRQKGILVGLEIKKEITQHFFKINLAEKIKYICLKNNLYIWAAGNNVVIFSPPLTITEEELKKSVEILFQSFWIINRAYKKASH